MMEPLLSSSSRQARRLCRNSQRTSHLMHRSITFTLTCPSCRTQTTTSRKATTTSRPWPSQTRTASTSQPTARPSPTTPPPPPKTHYDFFPQTLSQGPPPSGPFPIDLRALRREFLQLQAIAHPDRHPQSHKSRAEATSARINEAYKTLQSPLLRAQYLLSLHGIDVAADEIAKVEDAELLMEVLEAREMIEGASDEDEIRGLREVNEERIRRCEEVLGESLEGNEVERAKEEAVRLRYWVNIRESLDAWEKGKPVVLIH